MDWQHTVDHERDWGEGDLAGGRADPCEALEEEVEVLEEQIGLLEEGLPLAPGAQKTALAKEIREYQEKLDARRNALRRCRGGGD
jgi:hypothetical protein